MRKAITMIVVLALGVSLWAESSPTRPSKNDVEIRFPDRRPSDDRTETYELYMVDSYGDGWNGASLDLFVNETLVGDDLTIEAGSEGSFTFDVEDGDVVRIFPGTDLEKFALNHGVPRKAINESIDKSYHEVTPTLPFSKEFTEKCLQEAGVAMIPGTAFGTFAKDNVRFNFATSKENISKAIEKIDKILK